MKQIFALIRVFSYLSILTVGGGLAAFPEMRHLVVDVYHWLTFEQLIHLYSLGQVAPGPNMMMIVVIGEVAAGVVGAIIVLIAFFGPTAIFALLIGRLWKHLEKWPWRTSIERGLSPVSIGLLVAGCLSLARGAITGWVTALIGAAVLLILLLTRLNPALLVLAGAIAGVLAFGPVKF
jgi:chromate transporter